MTAAQRAAAEHYNTTSIDVANALAAGNLDPDELPAQLLAALDAEGIEPDEDPDNSLGWHWDDGEAVPDD